MASAMGEVITISNFAAKMSQLNAASSPLFALVDMGSNGIRFSVSSLASPTARLLQCVYKERAGISLYDALHEKHPNAKPFHFSQATIQNVAFTLSRFRRISDQYNVPASQISVFATEAMRTSQNRDEMLGAIKQASGLTVDILSPEAESLFGSLGARSGFVDAKGLFMDLGGGSVQMTYLDSTKEGYEVLAAQAAKSLPYGAARLSEALSSSQASETTKQLRNGMKATFDGMKAQFPELKRQAESSEGVTIYFCGGGFRGYGSMLMHTHAVQPYPIPSIGGFRASGKHFMNVKKMLKENDASGKIFGMSNRRRSQFPAIAAVVESLTAAVPNIKEVVFCSGGNREGVLYMKLDADARASNPLSFLTPTSSIPATPMPQSTSQALPSILPASLPALFTPPLLAHILNSTFLYQGQGDDINSAFSLHHPISGSISLQPGLDHTLRAVLALTLCARWGNDLGPIDDILLKQLRRLVGDELAWWCAYVGACLRFLAVVVPAAGEGIDRVVSCQAAWSNGLGKKGKKSGVVLLVEILDRNVLRRVDVEDALGAFGDVTKGLQEVEWKVEASVV